LNDFRAPESIDPVVVQEELRFYGIDLIQMIEDYDKEIAANNPKRPPSFKQFINNTVCNYLICIYESEISVN
jgi:hypothetical protein